MYLNLVVIVHFNKNDIRLLETFYKYLCGTLEAAVGGNNGFFVWH